MTRPTVPVPPGLIDALDCALDTGVRMRPEHICGVLDWLHGVIAMNVEHHVAFSVDEMVLIAHALGDAMGAPIHEIDTEHVRNIVAVPEGPELPDLQRMAHEGLSVLPTLLHIDDPRDLVPELCDVLRKKGFMEATCCGASVGMANHEAFDVGASPDFVCPSCGSSFVVAEDVPMHKVLVRKEDA